MGIKGHKDLRKTLLIILSSMCMTTACGEQKIVNNIKLVQTVGYDIEETGIQSAAIIANYEESGKAKLEFFQTKSSSLYDSMQMLNAKLDFPIEYGQLRMALFGETLARRGIEEVITGLNRDPKISLRMHLGVADGNSSDILNVPESKRDPYFLSDMIEQNMKHGNLPFMNLHETVFNYFGEGRDIYLPYFTVERGETKIEGLVLFKEDKYVTKIGMQEAMILKMLVGNSKEGSLNIPVRGPNSARDESFLMTSIGSKSSFKVIRVGLPASVAVHMKLEAQVRDVPKWIDLATKDQLDWLESMMASYFEKEIRKFISLCKRNNVDPIGFGDLIRSRSQKWDAQDFLRSYEALETTVNVNVTIVHTGR